jgi:hypothetical protein
MRLCPRMVMVWQHMRNCEMWESAHG